MSKKGTMPGAVMAIAAILLAGCGNAESAAGMDLERMREQPRYDRFEQSPFFADGRVMQQPPAGTVPRGRIVGQPLLTTGSADGVMAAEIPLPVTPGLLADGEERFAIFCAACHGAGGYGGSIVALNMQAPRPPSLHDARTRDMAPGRLYQVITEGEGRMPAYAAELSVPERWAVVAYLTLVLQQPHELAPAEQRDSARAARRARSATGSGSAARRGTLPL